MKRTKPKEPPKLLKLNIAGGQQRIEGYTNIDIARIKETDIVHDLNVYPWPIKSESVEEAVCSHYVEHIPMLCACCPSGKQDPLLSFFDELYRVMVVGGKCNIVAPYYSSRRCWQDPTHRRAIVEETFLYANANWRKQNRLDHYNVKADFDFTYGHAVAPDVAARAEDVRLFWITHYLNAVNDIQVTLIKRAPSPVESGRVVEMAHTNAPVNGEAHANLRRSARKVKVLG